MKVIVSDTTSLIALEGLQSIDLLCAVFESILIPQAVLKEGTATRRCPIHAGSGNHQRI
ncbi:hypothetical protein [Thiothrix lacustris]|jgi:predicted nucleic acid-binding protein|uniref:hypothetical protein n=1 Tax=Thiothrix lacustris TaxID=525917 RepID=UPI0027E58EB0|nr:hypothetical protein [Thiothrix lacustris]WMP17617.1 hypothetical protein RCS87_00780 [Thiothrix lacustris]